MTATMSDSRITVREFDTDKVNFIANDDLRLPRSRAHPCHGGGGEPRYLLGDLANRVDPTLDGGTGGVEMDRGVVTSNWWTPRSTNPPRDRRGGPGRDG